MLALPTRELRFAFVCCCPGDAQAWQNVLYKSPLRALMHRRDRPKAEMPPQECLILFSLRERFCDIADAVDEELRHRADRPIFRNYPGCLAGSRQAEGFGQV